MYENRKTLFFQTALLLYKKQNPPKIPVFIPFALRKFLT